MQENLPLLTGKTILVTGASRGLGRAISKSLIDDGADIALACHSRSGELHALCKHATTLGQRASRHQGDLADPDHAAALIHDIQQEHSRLDALVLNAGITLNRLLTRTSDADWDHVLNINLHATMRLCRAALPLLRAQGGHILLISSHAALSGTGGLAAYSASKAALIGLARSIAQEEAPHNIRTHVINP